MSVLGGFGGGFGFDSDLGSKIDKLLAGKPSAKQKVEEFLVDELHIDPSKIPLSLKDARLTINRMMGERDAQSALLHGTSMGLAWVGFTPTKNDQPTTCPGCSAQTYFHDLYDQVGNQWECDDCNHQFTWTKPKSVLVKVHEADQDKAWPELLRVYTSLLKHVEPEAVGDAPDCEKCSASNAAGRRAPCLCDVCEREVRPQRAPAFTKFLATHQYQEAEIQGIADKKPRWKRADKYPTGARLRITNGTESLYVMVGGPFSDDDITNLSNMKPIRNISAYSVVEVLDDGSGG